MNDTGYEGADSYSDFENDYDDFDPSEGAHEDASDSTLDTNEAVLKILQGNDLTDEEKASAQRRGGRETTSRPVNESGHTDWSAGGQRDSGRQQPQQKHETIYGHQVEEARSHAASEWQAAHAENDRLQRMYEEGQIDAQTLYNAQFEQGVRANKAQQAMLLADNMELRHSAQIKETHAALEQVMGDAWKPENRAQTQREILEWTQKHGITNETMAGITTEAEMMAVWNAFKNEKELESTKLELRAAKQMLKKQSHQLRGRQQKSAKDNNVGMRNRDTVDAVVDILNGARSGKRGGRR